MEFWMVEPEVAFAELADVIALAEEFLTSIVARVLERRREELKVLERDMNKLEVVVAPFPRITYAEAVERLQKKGNPIQPGDDFGGEEETDRKSTRLNSSHLVISYAVFCFEKKKT